MNESRQSEHIPSHMSDEELIRELEHWGEIQYFPSANNAFAIQRQANKKNRTTLRLTLFACLVMATAIMSLAWLTKLRRQDTSPREIAMETTPTTQDSELLLKSIAQRTQDIEFRIEGLNTRWQLIQAGSEIQELNAILLNYKRIAIRNAIVLSQIP